MNIIDPTTLSRIIARVQAAERPGFELQRCAVLAGFVPAQLSKLIRQQVTPVNQQNQLDLFLEAR